MENFSWLRGINHTPIHPGRAVAITRRFVGKYLVVRFSTTKTTKILPRKLPAIRYFHVHVHVHVLVHCMCTCTGALYVSIHILVHCIHVCTCTGALYVSIQNVPNWKLDSFPAVRHVVETVVM